MRKQILKWCRLFFIAVTVMVVVPMFFKKYPDFRFFWSTMVIIVTSSQIFWIIVGKKEKRLRRLRFVSIMLMSAITANELYSYDKLVIIFPVLKKIPTSLMIGIGAALLVLTAVGGGIYNMTNYFRRNKSGFSKNRTLKKNDESVQQKEPDITDLPQDNFPIDNVGNICPSNSPIDNSESTCQVNLSADNAGNTDQPDPQTESVKHPVPQLRQIVGVIFSAAISLAGMGIIFYILLTNQDFLQSHTLQQLPYHALSLLMTFGVIAMILFLIAIIIQACYRIVRQMYTQQKLDLQNDLFLKCVSGFWVVLYFIYGKSAPIEDLFNLVGGTNHLASLLAMVIAMAIIIVMTLVVYKTMKSLVNPGGYLRKSIDEIFRLILNIVCEAIKKLLNIAQCLPDVIEALPQIIKKGWEATVDILFESDEEDEEDGKVW